MRSEWKERKSNFTGSESVSAARYRRTTAEEELTRIDKSLSAITYLSSIPPELGDLPIILITELTPNACRGVTRDVSLPAECSVAGQRCAHRWWQMDVNHLDGFEFLHPFARAVSQKHDSARL
jgi:hypothetical protein